MDAKVMSIFAHQDDETFSAGGTLAKYGKNAFAVSVTFDKNRENEFLKACEILGVNAVQLENIDVSPSNQKEIKEQIVKLLLKYRPYHVITHVDFDYHHEHKMVRSIVEEAVEWASHTTSTSKAHQVSHLWAAESTVLIPVPHIFVDITEENPKRLLAIAAYESQSHKGGNGFYSRFHNTRTKLRGIQAEVAHAEAFLTIPSSTVGIFKPVKNLKYL